MTTDEILTETVQNEGGYVNNPNDSGGPTNFGITQATLSGWLKRPATESDVQNLTLDEAKEIYTLQYLSGPRIDQLPDPPEAFLFDCAVNHGAVTAVKILQRVINAAGFGPVGVDGVLGPTTRQCACTAQEQMGAYFQNALVDERLKFYDAIVASHPNEEVFLKGWTARAERYRLAV